MGYYVIIFVKNNIIPLARVDIAFYFPEICSPA